MARQARAVFLEEWLRTNSGGSGSIGPVSGHPSSSSSARAIIQAWSELRESLQNQSFRSHLIQSLKTLVNSQNSLHVAEPQAKLLISILSSQTIALPTESYPLLLRLLYIWVRKSFRPSAQLIDSAVDVLSRVFTTEFALKKSPPFLGQGILILGAISFSPQVSENSKKVCLDLLCKLLEEEHPLLRSSQDIIADVLAGIGYALSSSVNAHFARVLDSLFRIWGREDGSSGSVSTGLMILHLVEWVVSSFIESHSLMKIQDFARWVLETPKTSCVPFAFVMAVAGVLRACNRFISSGQGTEIVSKLKISAENQIASVAEDLISKTKGLLTSEYDPTNNLLLQCISLALAQSGSAASSRGSLLICLASTLLTEIFPLRNLYAKILKFPHSNWPTLGFSEVKEHLVSVAFKEAGSITGIFCNQYASVDEESKALVENFIWDYCQDVYLGHRQVALLLRGQNNELLADVEKIAESAFLMVVVFALAVTKHKLNSNFSVEMHGETSVRILVSFSCLEYFRRMRLPEYMDAIRGVVACIQENEEACVSFVESMPSYSDLTSWKGFSFKQDTEYLWSKDEVQTARILFYLRVIPTCIERLPAPVFRRVVAPTMFLYMEHPNAKVARASHSMFTAFVSSGKDFDEDERGLLKEQLVFYYVQRSLVGYPGITPFEGMASGVAALVRYLPAGSPATFYCIHSLVEKANMLCNDVSLLKADLWKKWQGSSEPCKKVLELLLRLISLVDIQVLPTLMKQLAQLIVQLPKDGQNMVLNELYAQVAESDDVTRKPTLVSWLQSVSYLCSRSESTDQTSKPSGSKENPACPGITDPSNLGKINARL
ncbi:hypothetical protein SLA2020_300220 [Shorea laevis]